MAAVERLRERVPAFTVERDDVERLAVLRLPVLSAAARERVVELLVLVDRLLPESFVAMWALHSSFVSCLGRKVSRQSLYPKYRKD